MAGVALNGPWLEETRRDIDPWLEELRLRRWTLHFFGRDRSTLTAIGAVLPHEDCADVIILRGHDSAAACRVPTHPDCDVFAPDWVTWWYANNDAAVWVLRAVLSLDPPGPHSTDAPLYVAPPCCRIPLDGRRPVTIRPT